MKKKLTLSIDDEIIANAKAYAKETDRSLSELIENYLHRITNSNRVEEPVIKYSKKENKIHSKMKKPSKYRKDVGILKHLDIDPLKDRERIREIRYEKSLK